VAVDGVFGGAAGPVSAPDPQPVGEFGPRRGEVVAGLFEDVADAHTRAWTLLARAKAARAPTVAQAWDGVCVESHLSDARAS